MKFTKYIITLFLLPALLLSACIDAELEEVLDYKNHYQTLSDADNAILGLYGKFTELAAQVVILNELRGDLMDITHNSSTDLQEINRGIPSKNNQYSDITPFYSVIQNCNDILYNFKIMKEDSRMSIDEYRERYSDVTALRCWVYLQLGIHFGEVIYNIDPIISIEDVLKAQDQKTVKLDELLSKLIDCMEEVNTNGTLDSYVVSPLVQEALDGYKLSDFFINKHLLLGDLYLWRGNDEYDYVQAATHYREVLRRNENVANVSNNHLYYKCSVTGFRDPNNTPQFEVTYWRYKEDDINSLENHWAKMFGYRSDVLNINASSETELSYEYIWAISYDASFAPTYPFTSLFANTGWGTYQLKPSQYIMNTWAEQEQKNNFVFDGRGENSSFKIVNGEPVIEKYLYHYDTTKPFEQSGR
ncbi:MAG: hypothetical protein LUE93_00950 [Bacteroides sp.]|nr:hypothetical protein [Bacteroides sp.]